MCRLCCLYLIFSKWFSYYCKLLYFLLDPEKTEALLATDRISFQYSKIILGEHEIEWKRNIKYLGVQLDRRLSFGFMQLRSGKVPLTTMLSRRSCSRHREVWCWGLSQHTELCRRVLCWSWRASHQWIYFRKDGRRILVEKWQTRWHDDQSGRWTNRLIPELATWLDRKHGQVRFYLAQVLSGHGCFNAYLKRFKKREDESCRYCGSLVKNAEHTLFVFARWGVAREDVGQAVCAQLTPDTMVSLMLQSEQKWMLIESFITLVMKTRELDGRAERGDNEGQ